MTDLSLDIQDHIAIVTLNRPPVNSLTRQTYVELQRTFAGIGQNKEVRAVLLRAQGNMFCAGNDVNEFVALTTAPLAKAYAQAVSDGIAAVYACDVPVVAAVRGQALGAGMALAACADVIVAAHDAVFGIPEIKVGVIGASAFLGLIVPEKVARYLALTGGSITAHEVMQYGGVHSVVPEQDVFDTAMNIALEISANAPQGVRHFKQAMNINHNAQLVEKYAVEAGFTARYVETEEARESVNAFVEQRKPDYQE